MPASRLLLFGSAGAGKTSLLGALAQAATVQAALLKGQLVDPAGVWGQLRQSTYDQSTPATDKLAVHDFKLQTTDNDAPLREVRISDCGGKLAGDMLNAKAPFADRHPLEKPILGADGILLLVDATLPREQLNDEFRRFGHWLTALKEARTRRIDIGDLPVFVVLTKCDALAKPEDSFARWQQKIEEAKRKIDDQFHKVFAEKGEGFGSLEVQFRATAIKRPAFTDRLASPEEPYGVAELFRECLGAAADFARRRQTSQGRMFNLLVGLVSSIAILGLSVAFLVDFQPGTQAAELEQQLQLLLPRIGATPTQRLSGTMKRLQEKAKRLADIEAGPEFDHLPTEARDGVRSYRREVERYLALSDQFKAKGKFPLMAETEQEYRRHENDLKELACPPEWDDTPIGKRVQQCRREYAAVDKAIAVRTAWYAEQTVHGDALLRQGAQLQLKVINQTKLAPQEIEHWLVQYRDQMKARPAAQESDPLPGVSGVTYEFLNKFQAIKAARKELDAVKTRLKRVAENIQDEAK